ncbi:MAG TPA: DUF2461 domain-containing protein [Chitinophagaceae bacterium]|nr:DUF2461 domain-containing protein [Chitinophagaceae bacterium]
MLKASTLKFLKDLKKNNNKPWFEAHRDVYEAARADFEAFIQSVLDRHSKNDPDLKELTAKKCMFRINRDVRFSKDKSPYKTNFGASMDKGGKKSGLAGYYFHCEPGKSFLGGGLWMPESPVVKRVRQEIDYSLDEFRKIMTGKKFKSFYGDLYTGEDVQLSKVPQGFEKDNPAAEYIRFRSWLVLHELSDAELTASMLVKNTVEAYKLMQPFVKFLNRAVEE